MEACGSKQYITNIWPMPNLKSPIPKHRRQAENIQQHNFTKQFINKVLSLQAAISQVIAIGLETPARTHSGLHSGLKSE